MEAIDEALTLTRARSPRAGPRRLAVKAAVDGAVEVGTTVARRSKRRGSRGHAELMGPSDGRGFDSGRRREGDAYTKKTKIKRGRAAPPRHSTPLLLKR